MAVANDRPECKQDDTTLEKWTFLRFVILGIIMLYRCCKIQQKGKELEGNNPTGHWDAVYSQHPRLTKYMDDGQNIVVRLFWAGCLFIQTEGVGLFIYFATAAALDNYTIYFVDNVKFCEYVMQVALYSMALLTFLPTAGIAYLLQGPWYDRGEWLGFKTVFVVVMVVATALSFAVRLYLVYKVGWDELINKWLKGAPYKLIVAITVPPVVDAFQTMLLVAASIFTRGAGTPPPNHVPLRVSDVDDESKNALETKPAPEEGNGSQRGKGGGLCLGGCCARGSPR